ncbi:MAG TPA: alpha/beta hydrolase [Mycobacterium sp.]|nr:alpha/beta hydrolase [Mycobacterium sp.]
MAMPALVLVHGGGYAGDCWDPTVAAVRRLEPQLATLAVDLPGRRGKPAASFPGWVESVVADIDAAGYDDVVIVGHSMAGLTVPEVVATLGPTRVREMILATAFVPPQGMSILDALTGPFVPVARYGARSDGPSTTPKLMVRLAFANGMSSAQRKFAYDKLCAESARIVTEPVTRRGIPEGIPRTWIMALRDRSLSPRKQYEFIQTLGGVDNVIPIDTCHMLMISEPELLAQILVQRCRQYT